MTHSKEFLKAVARSIRRDNLMDECIAALDPNLKTARERWEAAHKMFRELAPSRGVRA